MIFKNTWRYPVGLPQHDVLQKSKFWSYEFIYKGARIRETTNTADKATAKRIERERRRSLELGTARIDDERKPLTFAAAAKQYIELGSAHWSERNIQIEEYNVDALLPTFGKTLLTAITADDITRFQAAQKKREPSPMTINMAVGTMRAILRKHKLWAFIEEDVRMLTIRNEIGRALSADEQHRLLTACK